MILMAFYLILSLALTVAFASLWLMERQKKDKEAIRLLEEALALTKRSDSELKQAQELLAKAKELHKRSKN